MSADAFIEGYMRDGHTECEAWDEWWKMAAKAFNEGAFWYRATNKHGARVPWSKRDMAVRVNAHVEYNLEGGHEAFVNRMQEALYRPGRNRTDPMTGNRLTYTEFMIQHGQYVQRPLLEWQQYSGR